ncbi:hypothetical protein V8E55_008539 [Tylopilus felleus]
MPSRLKLEVLWRIVLGILPTGACHRLQRNIRCVGYAGLESRESQDTTSKVFELDGNARSSEDQNSNPTRFLRLRRQDGYIPPLIRAAYVTSRSLDSILSSLQHSGCVRPSRTLESRERDSIGVERTLTPVKSSEIRYRSGSMAVGFHGKPSDIQIKLHILVSSRLTTATDNDQTPLSDDS